MQRSMQKTRSLSIRTIILLIVSVLAITLCFTGTARAALAYFSPDYQAEFETTQLEVALTENDNIVEGDGTLLTWMADTNVVPGKVYEESLAAKNVGEYDQYVRVVVKKYWTDADGGKATDINPALIQLTQTGDWIVDEANSTDEQIVLYSTTMLPVGQSREFISELRIDPAIVMDQAASKLDTVNTEEGKTIYTTTYTIDGYSFNIEAEVDAVQTHNAPDAIKSVWGYDVAASQLS